MRNVIHRAFRRAGLHLQRWRDPYEEISHVLQGVKVSQVVDGGAQFGDHSQKLLTRFPGATVHAFEPQPDTFAKLQARFNANARVHVYQCALSDRQGEAAFHINQQGFTSSLLPTLEPEVMQPVRTQTVPLTTLDGWTDQQHIAVPEIIKLDLQGHEAAALRGAKRILQNGVRAVLAEVNFRERYQGTCMFHEVAELLHESGFLMWRMYEIINSPHGGWQQADVLFVRREFVKD